MKQSARVQITPDWTDFYFHFKPKLLSVFPAHENGQESIPNSSSQVPIGKIISVYLLLSQI